MKPTEADVKGLFRGCAMEALKNMPEWRRRQWSPVIIKNADPITGDLPEELLRNIAEDWFKNGDIWKANPDQPPMEASR
jgi:hypothetical protein